MPYDRVYTLGLVIVGAIVGWLVTWYFQRESRGLKFWQGATAVVLVVVVFYWLGVAINAVVHEPAKYMEAAFWQAFAACFAALGGIALVIATIALVRVTQRLDVATEISTHAQTAPQIQVSAWVMHDPSQSTDPQNIAYGKYVYDDEDKKHLEFSAFAVQQPTGTPRRYLVIAVSNTQKGSTYATVTSLNINVSLFFPKTSAIATGFITSNPNLGNLDMIQRELTYAIIPAEQMVTVKAFRVDPLPEWAFAIGGLSYQNHQGENCSSAVGVQSGAWSPQAGLSTTITRYNPQAGEVPIWPKRKIRTQ